MKSILGGGLQAIFWNGVSAGLGSRTGDGQPKYCLLIGFRGCLGSANCRSSLLGVTAVVVTAGCWSTGCLAGRFVAWSVPVRSMIGDGSLDGGW